LTKDYGKHHTENISGKIEQMTNMHKKGNERRKWTPVTFKVETNGRTRQYLQR
jgi:hypothetical protein